MRALGTAPAAAVLLAALAGISQACLSDADCGCDGAALCLDGACTPAFTLPVFPIAGPTASAYTTSMIAALDHASTFYTGCCDDRITTFRGETATRTADAALCPALPIFPGCLFANCLCAYGDPDGPSFVVNGTYVGVVGATHLSYDGHAGYDYEAGFGTALVATRAGQLCKALADPVNGTAGQPTAWDAFHTFYVDHGVADGSGWASWYLHAAALDAPFAGLAPGDCAPVATGTLVATAGNHGTFVPHLHFEVRRYLPADGPEAVSARVVDPYGWRGRDPDPWSDPNANVQAATQGPALWRGCGNGRIECGETCDDGNALDGDCCSATCTVAPRTDCRRPVKTDAAALRIQAGGDTGDRLQWKWRKGAATLATDFGDPASTTRYHLCGFTEDGAPALVFAAAVPAGGTCGTRPCWKAKGTPAGSRGFGYRDPAATADGVDTLVLKPGPAGASSFTVKARGESLTLPPLPSALPLRLQLSAEGGACWEARYDAAGVRQHDAAGLDARGD